MRLALSGSGKRQQSGNLVAEFWSDAFPRLNYLRQPCTMLRQVVGVILSPLHVHPLKFFPLGPPQPQASI